MKRFFPLIAATALATPMNAAASSDTTRVAMVVPVTCAIEVIGGKVAANHLSVTLRRRCNTTHLVMISAVNRNERATMRFNGVTVSMAPGFATLPQSQRYFDGIDTIDVDMRASRQEMERYLAGLRFGIEQA